MYALIIGGVGHNIAHNLRLLGAEVRILTVLGGDGFAVQIVRGRSSPDAWSTRNVCPSGSPLQN